MVLLWDPGLPFELLHVTQADQPQISFTFFISGVCLLSPQTLLRFYITRFASVFTTGISKLVFDKTMDRLPTELMRHVMQHVAQDDDHVSRNALKSLRLLNQAYHTVSTPLLFKTMGLWFSLRSLENLSNVSTHPTLYALNPFWLLNRLM